MVIERFGAVQILFVLINTGTCYRDYLYRIFNFRGFFRNGFVFESDACSFWILLTRAYPDERMRFCCLQLVHYMYTYIVLLYMYR